jgi:hypothetical protein
MRSNYSRLTNPKSPSLGFSTAETNRDQAGDFWICRDQLLKPVKIFSTVETRFLPVLVEIFKIETWLGQDFSQDCQDCRECQDYRD